LIDAVANATDLSKATAERMIDSTVQAIVHAVARGETVTLVGFGTFKSAHRAARTGMNPRTREVVKIAARTVPRFSPGSHFKLTVSGKSATKAKSKKK